MLINLKKGQDHREKGMYVVYVYCMRIRKQSMAPALRFNFYFGRGFRSFRNISYNKEVKASVEYLIIWINKSFYQSVE